MAERSSIFSYIFAFGLKVSMNSATGMMRSFIHVTMGEKGILMHEKIWTENIWIKGRGYMCEMRKE